MFARSLLSTLKTGTAAPGRQEDAPHHTASVRHSNPVSHTPFFVKYVILCPFVWVF